MTLRVSGNLGGGIGAVLGISDSVAVDSNGNVALVMSGKTAQATEEQHEPDHMEVSFLSTPYAHSAVF